MLGYAKLSLKLKSTLKRYKKCKCSVNSPSKWQRNPFFNSLCPGGFASTAFATSVLLALLLKNNSCCVQSLLCPPLRKTEPPNAAHMTKNEQKTLCQIFNKFHKFTIFLQSGKYKEWNISGATIVLYFSSNKCEYRLYQHTHACTHAHTHTRTYTQ